jgi:hypothetical protein
VADVTSVEGYNLNPTSDPNISAGIQNQTSYSNQDLANQYGSGNAQATGLLNSANPSFDRNLDYGNQALTSAIQSRYSQGFNQNMARLNTSILQNADADHLMNLNAATQAASQEVELNRQKALLAWKIDQQNKKARGQILGTTLGIVGGIGGAVAGSFAGGVGAGPGAMAGYALGSGVGQSIGQNG